MDDIKFMKKAIKLSIESIKNGGGPFGAAIVKDGKIIATGVNRVTANTDPTAHAEVNAIRKASKKLGTFNLSTFSHFNANVCNILITFIVFVSYFTNK